MTTNNNSFILLITIIVIDVIFSFIIPNLSNFTSIAIILSLLLWYNFICIFYAFS